MNATARHRHHVAVVRVEVCHTHPAPLRIEILQVGHDRDPDTLLGRTTNTTDACRMLNHWLTTLTTNRPPPPDAADEATDQ